MNALAVSDHNSNQPFPGKVAMVQGRALFLTPAATPREVLKVSQVLGPRGEIKTSAKDWS